MPSPLPRTRLLPSPAPTRTAMLAAILPAAVLVFVLSAACVSLPRHVLAPDCYVAAVMEAGEGEDAAFVVEARSCGRVEWTVLQALAIREAARAALGLGWKDFALLGSISAGWNQEATEWKSIRLRIGPAPAALAPWKGPYSVEGLAAWLGERSRDLTKTSFSVAVSYTDALLSADKAVEPSNLELRGP